MKIDNQVVTKIAQLAKLEFEGDAQEAIKDDLSKIIDLMQVLEEVDTQGVEPLIFLSESYNNWREDVAANSISKEQALKNVPYKDSDYIKVNKSAE